MKKKTIRYRLYILHPKTKKWGVAITASKLPVLAKKIGINIYMAPDYYSFEGKRCKLRLVAEKLEKNKWSELEEYTITKDWKIKGFFEWDKLS